MTENAIGVWTFQRNQNLITQNLRSRVPTAKDVTLIDKITLHTCARMGASQTYLFAGGTQWRIKIAIEKGHPEYASQNLSQTFTHVAQPQHAKILMWFCTAKKSCHQNKKINMYQSSYETKVELLVPFSLRDFTAQRYIDKPELTSPGTREEHHNNYKLAENKRAQPHLVQNVKRWRSTRGQNLTYSILRQPIGDCHARQVHNMTVMAS